MSENKKPRIAEILGVEVGERFSVKGQRGGDPLYVDRDGWVRYESDDGISSSAVQIAINHPDRIIRKSRWTEQDKEDAMMIKRLIPWANQVNRGMEGSLSLNPVTAIDRKLFPLLKPGESATLDEIIGGTE